jgi:hypothetical protein
MCLGQYKWPHYCCNLNARTRCCWNSNSTISSKAAGVMPTLPVLLTSLSTRLIVNVAVQRLSSAVERLAGKVELRLFLLLTHMMA